MIESGDKRLDVHFVRSDSKSKKMHTDPRFKGFKVCSENLVFEFLRKKYTDLRRNWAVGFAILELSKYIMTSIYYKVMQPTFGNSVSLCFSDTDSFAVIVPVESSRVACEMLSPIMDFSNYATDDPLFNNSRKNCTGYIKNEVSQDEICEYVGLKAKTYAIRTKSKQVESKCKGVKKSAKKDIRFTQFLSCVRTIRQQTVDQHTIGAKDHINKLLHTRKTAFNSFDDKRYLTCPRHSVPYGSVLIKYHVENNGRCYACDNPNILI